MAVLPSKFHLLEINLISAQDIAKVCKSMQTYAVAWVHPDRKLTTRTDTHGGTNPTWNDKFVFRVDTKFLDSDSSAVMIEIYSPHWFRPIHVGTVRVLVGNLIPPQTRTGQNPNQLGMRFVALQVRRSSGRPQGILNVGVTVLDSTMRSMPLYTLLSSAAGYQKLMGGQDNNRGANKGSTSNNQPELRRSLSEKSSVVNSKGGSIVNRPTTSFANNKDIGSIVEANKRGAHKSRDDMYDKPLSVVDGDRSDLGLASTLKAQDGKADSVLSYASSVRRPKRRPNKKSPSSIASRSNIGLPPLIKHINKSNNGNNFSNKNSPNKGYNNNYREYPNAKNSTSGSVLSVSDIGPSPSEVAAAIAEDSKYREGGRSMLEYEESEGVGTRLERWRREVPNNGYECSPSSCDGSSLVFAGGNNHRNRRKGGGGGGGDGGGGDGDGRFRCFGKICGHECSIVCGSDVGPKKKKKGGKRRRGRAPSESETASTYL